MILRWSALILAVVLLGACSASVDTDTSTAGSDDASTETADDAETTDEAANDGYATDATPVAPKAVTASTIHESRTDDFPDITAAQATPDGEGSWRFDVTVSSPYDSPQRYADAWRVVGTDGTEYGIRVLTHDHASEQPFTRSQSGIIIPAGVTTVIVEGRDQANGWGGGTLTVALG